MCVHLFTLRKPKPVTSVVRFGRLLPVGIHRGQAIVYSEGSPSGEHLADVVVVIEASPARA